MRTIKHAALSEFHSAAEYLQAGLSEGDLNITAYVPQPYRLRVGNRLYTPDLYVLYRDHRSAVIEIKPEAHREAVPIEALQQFFRQYGMAFEVWTNEAIFSRAAEARNWLHIVGLLNAARWLDVDAERRQLAESTQCMDESGIPLHALVEVSRDEKQWRMLIALLRALHDGHLCADLKVQPMDWNTRIFHGPYHVA
ncbi:TnsA endonuclease N-terminal domain-containing protein [Parahalioglobus pacificus]|nr:TnsA endonuclease N-terminal domain-containing protein [Halioglobus pacificus]